MRVALARLTASGLTVPRLALPRLALAVALALAAPVTMAPLPYLGAADPALADQTDPRLDHMFKRLLKAESADEAEQIEGEIWAVWIKSGDEEADKLMATGWEAMQQHDFPTALDAFTKLVTQKPDFAEGWNKRATLYYLMEEDDKSLADIDKTLALEPRHFGAISGQGLIHFRHERYEEAAKAYQRVLDFDPMNAGAQGNLDAIKDIIKKKSI